VIGIGAPTGAHAERNTGRGLQGDQRGFHTFISALLIRTECPHGRPWPCAIAI
jgi:hypothetical protein